MREAATRSASRRDEKMTAIEEAARRLGRRGGRLGRASWSRLVVGVGEATRDALECRDGERRVQAQRDALECRDGWGFTKRCATRSKFATSFATRKSRRLPHVARGKRSPPVDVSDSHTYCRPCGWLELFALARRDAQGGP